MSAQITKNYVVKALPLLSSKRQIHLSAESFSRPINSQFIGNRKDIGHPINPDIGEVAISLAAYHSLERHVAVFYDDVDRRHGA